MDLLTAIRAALAHASLPVISLPELLDRLHRSGVALTRSVVERETDGRRSGLRRLPAATGALGQLRDALPAGEPAPALDACLVIEGTTGLRPTPRSGLELLGRSTDLASTRDRARWSRLVAEAAELPPAA